MFQCESTQLVTDKLQETSDDSVQRPGVGKVPPNRAKSINKKPGFVYMLITIDYIKGSRFGLGIKHYKDQVVVSKSEEGSVCGDRLKRLDHIIDVNGTQVADRDVCREMLIKSLQKTNTVSLVIERPLDKNAIAAMEKFLAEAGAPSVATTPVRETNKMKTKNTDHKIKEGSNLKQIVVLRAKKGNRLIAKVKRKPEIHG